MRALCWNGINDLRVQNVPDPEIVNPHDIILRTTMSMTCGSDLHFIDGYIPTMRHGDVIGHEFMGVVEEVGPEVRKVKKGDRVVVPSFIVCGACWYCQHGLYSLCDNTNPNAELQEPLLTCSGVVFPDRFSPVFTLRADCTLLTLKQAKQSRLFFQVFW
jgi:threonine dehydrogenase-like Zn-dependent dehydrogenase